MPYIVGGNQKAANSSKKLELGRNRSQIARNFISSITAIRSQIEDSAKSNDRVAQIQFPCHTVVLVLVYISLFQL